MKLTYFAYIAGIASILGLALQVFNVFPKHAGLRKSVFLVVLGVFIGTLLNALDASHISFHVRISGFTLLVATLAVVIVGFLIAGVTMPDSRRREELFAIGGIGCIVFIIVLFFGSLITGDMTSPAIEKSRLTVSELLELADSAEKKGNFDRAIMHRETVLGRFQFDDLRRKKIEKKIAETKARQVK